ncbi:uncharacterized protein EI97DRAFT_429569 [Westerdykella ornata]|uniref:Uncharacterized protein n=1 Tax=Westerdykella ornata TaxID=318751 RepID=A0A6A6JYS1_WESOR|nr:uncharacterized protein EI97DRAFT_429569 [Westerdykella ornata]KAF2281557.1 hypothetical protein EI97DRAFT_429569 [Westerdykella ornata]
MNGEENFATRGLPSDDCLSQTGMCALLCHSSSRHPAKRLRDRARLTQHCRLAVTVILFTSPLPLPLPLPIDDLVLRSKQAVSSTSSSTTPNCQATYPPRPAAGNSNNKNVARHV